MILLSTASLQGYGVHRMFEFVKEAGYDGIDLYLHAKNHDLWDADYLKELSDEHDVAIPSITVATRGMSEKKVDQIVQIATTLKTQLITFTPPHFTDKNTTWFTRYLNRIKRDTHLSIAVKNVEPKFILFVIPEYKSSTLMDIKKVTGDTALDLASIDASSGMDILKAQKILGSTVKNVFLGDKHGNKTGLLPGGSGGGVSYLPLESFLLKMKTTGYNGFITLKVKPQELGVGNKQRVMQNLEYAKKYYKKHFLDYKA
ncbi:sugar phosphate isomerase/epimerase [Candidatus Gracilibacteria bacterium]|nr:sugar phosphate isomerase/epimerase [Candidatus Gracilibacteria bacterium]